MALANCPSRPVKKTSDDAGHRDLFSVATLRRTDKGVWKPQVHVRVET